MIRINPIELSIHYTEADLSKKICSILKIESIDASHIHIVRRSIDARKKADIRYSYMIDVELDDESSVLKRCAKDNKVSKAIDDAYKLPGLIESSLKERPVIVGFGPAGMFAALSLARAGLKPIVLERGEKAADRVKTVDNYWATGKLNPESHVSYGEGGAGTFSDGKLNTLVKDKYGYNKAVLRTLVEFGADEDILYEQKPHIGTDKLVHIVSALREEVISLGGEVRFHTKMESLIIKDKKICGVKLSDGSELSTSVVILAIGHSARDTYASLYKSGIYMEAKAFALGVRIQHPQHMIDVSQFGDKEADFLSPAAYKLTGTAKSGRGVYTFCMCPGGYVVDASTEAGMIAVNGMSYHARDTHSANSAIIVSVTPEDYGSDGPLAGIEYQRHIEKAAFDYGHGCIPVQLLGDFKRKIISSGYGDVEPCFKGRTSWAPLHEILPEYIGDAICDVLPGWDRKIHGFDRDDAILAGVESRTSSPVRISRGESMESDVTGLYPCGEGAGYAGGITSAAMDGLKIAAGIIDRYKLG